MTDSAIFADADVTIRAGTGEGHLSGTGSRLSFETIRLTPFLASLPMDSSRGARAAADQLASMGLSMTVIERGVPILDVGNVESSLIARAFGVRNIRVRRPLRLLARYLRR
jgi:hypothetical protein